MSQAKLGFRSPILLPRLHQTVYLGVTLLRSDSIGTSKSSEFCLSLREARFLSSSVDISSFDRAQDAWFGLLVCGLFPCERDNSHQSFIRWSFSADWNLATRSLTSFAKDTACKNTDRSGARRLDPRPDRWGDVPRLAPGSGIPGLPSANVIPAQTTQAVNPAEDHERLIYQRTFPTFSQARGKIE